MSAFFPTAEYAEDQALSKTILVSHVMYRGFQSGATVGLAIGAVRAAIPAIKARQILPSVSSAVNASKSSSSTLYQSLPHQPLGVRHMSSTPTAGQIAQKAVARSALVTIERHAGVAGLVGAAACGLMMPAYMYGQEKIQWQDRSYRLLANKGQVEVDSFSLVGAAIGLASSQVYSSGASSWKTILGRTGMGSMVGVIGYMGWRYGVHGGKFE